MKYIANESFWMMIIIIQKIYIKVTKKKDLLSFLGYKERTGEKKNLKVFPNQFMFKLIIYNNNNLFLFLWLWIIIVIISFIENIFDITWNRRRLSHCHLFVLHLHYSHLHYTSISTFTFPFITLNSHIRFCKIIHACDVFFIVQIVFLIFKTHMKSNS